MCWASIQNTPQPHLKRAARACASRAHEPGPRRYAQLEGSKRIRSKSFKEIQMIRPKLQVRASELQVNLVSGK